MNSITLTAPAIMCEGCAGSIQRSLLRLKGVRGVTVGIADKSVKVEFDDTATDVPAIKERLESAGFPTE